MGVSTDKYYKVVGLVTWHKKYYIFWWSTSILAVDCRLLDHVIHHKLRRKITVAKAEQINKISKTIFTENE